MDSMDSMDSMDGVDDMDGTKDTNNKTVDLAARRQHSRAAAAVATTTTATTTATAADPPARIGQQPLRRVGTHALRKQLRALRGHLAALESDDPEVVHDARVAVRRARTYARMLQDAPPFRAGRLRALAARLRPLADALGAARDLDVLLQRVQMYAEDAEAEQAGLPALRDTLLWQRRRAGKHLARVLADRTLARQLAHPRRAAKRLTHRGPAARRVLVRHFAGDALWRRYEAILAHEAAMPGASPAELHQVRIACKRLRYALELFADTPPSPRASWLISTLTDAQTHLGNLQDCVFALHTLAQVRRHCPTTPAIAAFARHEEAQRDALRAEFAAHWERLSGARFRKTLAELIAAL